MWTTTFLTNNWIYQIHLNRVPVFTKERITFRKTFQIAIRFVSHVGSWFELRAFTCIANAVPITNRICALRGNILFLLRSPRWLTHAWLQCAFPKCTRTNHVPKELCVHIILESGFLRGSRSKTPFFFRVSKARFERALHSQRVKSGFQIRKGLNHVPKRLSERDSFSCEQAQCKLCTFKHGQFHLLGVNLKGIVSPNNNVDWVSSKADFTNPKVKVLSRLG